MKGTLYVAVTILHTYIRMSKEPAVALQLSKHTLLSYVCNYAHIYIYIHALKVIVSDFRTYICTVPWSRVAM